MTLAPRRPWYDDYFTPDFWAVAAFEYDEERTTREVAYLRAVFAEYSAGDRLVDLGSGLGRHAIPLAAAGYDVVGLDSNAHAIQSARTRSGEAGVKVTWHQIDLLSNAVWPVHDAAGAYALQAFGWGSDAATRRMLRRVHDVLEPDGVFVLDHSNLLCIVRNYAPEAVFEAADIRVSFHRRLDAVLSRSRGSIDVERAEHTTVLRDDIRLYTPTEVVGLLEQSGFDVIAVDGDFVRGGRVDMDTRYVQMVARRAEVPPRVLGPFERRAEPPRSTDSLDLSWSPDEAELVSYDAWRDLFEGELHTNGSLTRAYTLDDPFGARRASQAFSRAFDINLAEDNATVFGGGVSGALRDLAGLADRALVACDGNAHPDLVGWHRAAGGRVRSWTADGAAHDIVRCIAETAPDLVLIDNPSRGGRLLRIKEMAEVADFAARVGACVVVDESYANYVAGLTAAPLVATTTNLVVLRGVSKAYCAGGLRIAFALHSAPLTGRVRALSTPLSAPPLLTALATRLIEAPDLLQPVIDTVIERKPVIVERLCRIGVDATASQATLPWVFAAGDAEMAAAEVAARGIVGRHVGDRFRLCVPFNQSRWQAFLDRTT